MDQEQHHQAGLYLDIENSGRQYVTKQGYIGTSRVNSTQILLHRFVFTIWSWRIQVEPGGCLRAGNIISLLSHDDISDHRSQNILKLDDHVLHLHDGHGGGDGDHLHGPRGVNLYHTTLKQSTLLAFRNFARIYKFL